MKGMYRGRGRVTDGKTKTAVTKFEFILNFVLCQKNNYKTIKFDFWRNLCIGPRRQIEKDYHSSSPVLLVGG